MHCGGASITREVKSLSALLSGCPSPSHAVAPCILLVPLPMLSFTVIDISAWLSKSIALLSASLTRRITDVVSRSRTLASAGAYGSIDGANVSRLHVAEPRAGYAARCALFLMSVATVRANPVDRTHQPHDVLGEVT
jgi:hypothetical protein